ncbi:MAG: hypothetical protein Q8O67_31715 [Deltaproteobacteria bacterium]|nr:hypothetical protein [Deltaproteobacteria bacterium]
MSQDRSPVGAALAAAITRLRTELKDPTAPIAVIVTAGPNGVLARRTLTSQGGLLRVWFETPEGLLQSQTPVGFWAERRREPAGWLRVTLAAVLEQLAKDGELGRFADVLVRPGWRNPLASALARLEGENVTPEHLLAVVGEASLCERAAVLGKIQRALQQARAADGIAPSSALIEAATAAIGGTEGIGAANARGAIVVGDKDLPHQLFTFLQAWLAGRQVLRLQTPASAALPMAPCGLSAAAGAAPTTTVDVTALPDRLQRLSTRLFLDEAAGAASAVDDGTVTFVRTPDDVRECAECVREVQRAIAGGTPLDRIAVVMPDGQQRGALEEALDRADIPRTWFVGFPAGDLVSARVLRIAVDMACGDETVDRLYELLSHPALQLRSVLGPDGVRGRGRWRRLLAGFTGARGIERIIAALERLLVKEMSATADKPAASPPPLAAAAPGSTTTDAVASDADSIASLLASITAVQAALSALRQPGPLGLHARAWRGFVEKLVRTSEPRGRLLALLEPLTLSTLGPMLLPEQAREELQALLDKEIARGALTERSLAVLPPLHLSAADFDVVCVLGLTEGRFPPGAKEDAVLPDALLRAVSAVVGRPLPVAGTYREVERRRFAACVGAARQKLWLSSAAMDFETERPTLPSTLVLAALSAVLGRRARFFDLEVHCVRAGSRARAYPLDEATALGEAEHLLARTATSPATTLPALLTHPTSRGLLQLHRSMDRLRQGQAMDAWTGHVPFELLPTPGLDGAAVSLALLEDLLARPADVFFRHMLGAYPARSLRQRHAPLERRSLEELFTRIATDETFVADDLLQALVASAMTRLAPGVQLGSFLSDDLVAADRLIGAIAAVLANDAELYCRAGSQNPESSTAVDLAAGAAAQGRLVVEGLPWRVSAVKGRLVTAAAGDGDEPPKAVLVEVLGDAKHKKKIHLDVIPLSLSALVLLREGKPVSGLHVVTPTGKSGTAGMDEVTSDWTPALVEATKRARLGQYAQRGHRTFGLVADALAQSGDGDGDGDGAANDGGEQA